MAKEVTRWLSDNGEEYPTEVEALRADNELWRKRAELLNTEVCNLKKNLRRAEYSGSSYGSSGGGGHD